MSSALAFILSIFSLQCLKSIATEPPEHSLVHDNEVEAVPPAMVTFFGGNRAPEAENSTVPKWALPSPELHQKQVSGWWRPTMLGMSVVCGVAGIGFLVGWVIILVVHFRKSRREVQFGAA